MPTAINGVYELPFLDLGNESRVHAEGKFFGVLDDAVMLNETEIPFYNDTETEIYASS